VANFHPTENTLLEFSAGNLDWAMGICVSAHLQLCPHCRHKVSQFNKVGGAVLDNAKTAELAPSSFTNLMQRIQTASVAEPAPSSAPEPEDPRTKDLPDVVKKLIANNKTIKWSSVSPGLKAARLATGQDKYEVSFHKIKRGSKVAEHDHRGTEITLVLEGSFSDANGNYVPGDYIVKTPGDIHRPMASQDQDCLCLSVVEAPVKVTGLMGKIVNPFLTIRPI